MADAGETESFDISTNDWEDAFHLGQRRYKLTKEQRIYGIWAQHSDDDEDAKPSHLPRSVKRSQLLHGGLNFIHGGTQQEEKDSQKKEDKEDSDEEVDTGHEFGSGKFSSDEDTEVIKRTGFEKIKKSLLSSIGEGQKKSDMGTSLTQSKGGSNIGIWERHTTGIGSKLLRAMGYQEGKGLGKNLQGISTPVEANKRKGKGAIGFYGAERTERSLADFPVHDSDEEEKETFKEKLYHWKKTTSAKKTKYVYKSTEDVIKEGKTKKLRDGSDSHITKTKVIDMTGPETRVLSSYHAIGGQKTIMTENEEIRKKKYNNFDIPELVHNLNMLLEMMEEEIVQNARTVERESDQIVHLTHERERYEKLLEKEEKELTNVDEVLVLIDKLESKHSDKVLTISEAASIFTEIKFTYPQIYQMYEIAYLGPTYITPLLKELLSTWNPLAQPCLNKDVMHNWQVLLESEGACQLQQQPVGQQTMDPYHQILWETWAAAVRSAVMGPWDPHDCGPLIVLLDSWRPPLIPPWIHCHLIQNIVLPRITRAVHSWNPLEDTVPIHTWVHPWLPMLSDHMNVVYPVIRQKLSSALIHWHPSDRSAKMVLAPWKGVFSEISMTALIQSSIKPKLETALCEMEINPHSQKLERWHWFKDWEDFIPVLVMLDILERCFFPRWFQALGAWLSTAPAHQDVVSWYKGWRELMPTSVVSHQQIHQKFQQALEICRRALSFQSGSADQLSILLSGLEKLVEPPPPPPPGSPPKHKKQKDWDEIISSSYRHENLSMKEILDRRCQEQGIVFVPLADRNHEGRPVYRCGSKQVSFNKNIIYVNTEKGWIPRSITTLLDEA